MTRSVAEALTRIWNADIALADRAKDNIRLHDLATIEARVRAYLPVGVLTACRAARRRSVLSGARFQARFLKSQESLPGSMMSQ
jgi:hypothetical protein